MAEGGQPLSKNDAMNLPALPADWGADAVLPIYPSWSVEKSLMVKEKSPPSQARNAPFDYQGFFCLPRQLGAYAC
jgi:hypothetical protein